MAKSNESAGRLPPALTGASLDTSAALAVIGPDFRVTLWSRGAQTLWGYDPEEVMGSPLVDLFTPARSRLRHRDGRPLDARVDLTPLLDGRREAGFLLTALP